MLEKNNSTNFYQNILSILNKYGSQIDLFFKLSTFFFFSFFFKIPITSQLIFQLSLFTFFFALILKLIYQLAYIKEIFFPGFLVLVLFLFSNILTYNLVGKFSFAVGFEISFMALLFFLLLPTKKKTIKKQLSQEFHSFSFLIFVVGYLLVIASLVMLFTGYNSIFCSGKICYEVGIIGTRLYGIFADPNYASLLSSVLSVLGYYFFSNSKNTLIKIFSLASILCFYLFIVFAYSRTGILSFAFTWLFLTFNIFYNKIFHQKEKIRQRIFLSFLSASVIFILIITVPSNIRNLYNRFYQDNSIERSSFVETEDISNNRFDIWKSGIEVFLENPIIGIGYQNISNYMEEHHPDSYIAQHEKTYEFHNMFLDILASQGIIGFSLFFIFVIWVLNHSIRHFIFLSHKNEEDISLVLMSILFAISIGAMFISDILYMYTPTSILFWVYLGYLMIIVVSVKNEN